MATLIVRGQALVPARPDELQLMVFVSIVGKTAETALADAAERTRAIQDLLEELGIGDDRWSTSGVSVRQERESERGRMVDRGFRAEGRIVIRLADPAVVGRLMNEAVSRGQAQIEGPWWRVNLENRARVDACKHPSPTPGRRPRRIPKRWVSVLERWKASSKPEPRGSDASPLATSWPRAPTWRFIPANWKCPPRWTSRSLWHNPRSLRRSGREPLLRWPLDVPRSVLRQPVRNELLASGERGER
jgi:Protein of unknown function (DUF541)